MLASWSMSNSWLNAAARMWSTVWKNAAARFGSSNDPDRAEQDARASRRRESQRYVHGAFRVDEGLPWHNDIPGVLGEVNGGM